MENIYIKKTRIMRYVKFLFIIWNYKLRTFGPQCPGVIYPGFLSGMMVSGFFTAENQTPGTPYNGVERRCRYAHSFWNYDWHVIC